MTMIFFWRLLTHQLDSGRQTFNEVQD